MANAKPTRLGESEAKPNKDQPEQPEVTTEQLDAGPGKNKTRKTVVKRGNSTITFYRH